MCQHGRYQALDFGAKLKNSSDDIISKIKLSGKEWEEIREDFSNSETKAIMCAKYNLKGHQYKALKKFFLGDSNE
jgi:hypothetical protein